MAARNLRRRARLAAVVLAAFAILAGGGEVVPVERAQAQERVQRPWSLRDLFPFMRRQPRAVDAEQFPPAPKAPAAKPKPKPKAKPRRVPTPAADAATEPPPVIVEKAADAKTVLVVGDFVAAGIAEGLDAIFAANARVRVVDRSNAASGFVRDDFLDWPGSIAAMIAKEKPAAIVFAAGANDRQQMRVNGTREAVRSDNWTAEYTRRAYAFAKAAADAKVPLVWVGIPAFKSPKVNSDMLALNEVFQGVAAAEHDEFVDVWDGFVDENGAFVSTGPDINGQPVRLRAGDEVNFTAPGKRKLAFYAEKPLRKLLGESGTAETAPAAAAPLPPAAVDPNKPVPTDRTAPMALNDPELDGGSALLGEQIPAAQKKMTAAQRLAAQGLAPGGVAGRADDFAWPQQRPPSADATAATSP